MRSQTCAVVRACVGGATFVRPRSARRRRAAPRGAAAYMPLPRRGKVLGPCIEHAGSAVGLRGLPRARRCVRGDRRFDGTVHLGMQGLLGGALVFALSLNCARRALLAAAPCWQGGGGSAARLQASIFRTWHEMSLAGDASPYTF